MLAKQLAVAILVIHFAPASANAKIKFYSDVSQAQQQEILGEMLDAVGCYDCLDPKNSAAAQAVEW